MYDDVYLVRYIIPEPEGKIPEKTGEEIVMPIFEINEV